MVEPGFEMMVVVEILDVLKIHKSGFYQEINERGLFKVGSQESEDRSAQKHGDRET